MPKKISIQQKRDWLDSYENGKSIDAIRETSKRGMRTIKKALDDARIDRDARFARAELIKATLYKHQARLEEGLNRIVKSLDMPRIDFAPLSWNEGENSIFTWTANVRELTGVSGISLKKGRPLSSAITVDDMLRQHFRNDKTWKLLVQWEKSYLTHMTDRLALQQKLIALLKQKTGYSIIDRKQASPPFLYSYTSGPILYEAVLESALTTGQKYALEHDIVANTQSGAVKYRNSILAEAPGNEEKCCDDILDVYRALLNSSGLTQVRSSYGGLLEDATKAKRAVDEITFLEYIPGQCSVCKRLGM